MDIDWRLASGNPFASFAEGLQGGMQMKRQRERDNLFAQQQAFEIQQAQRQQALQDQALRRQEAVGSAVAKNDYAGARTAAGGDIDLLKSIGEMDAQRRKELDETNEFAARQLYALQGLPPEEQARRWQAVVPTLVQRGANAEELNIDFNDPAAIQRELAEAMSLKEMIAQANTERDDKRAEMTAAETARANREREAQGRSRIGIAADTNRRGWASFNERKKAGGFGTPGVGGAVIPDDAVEIDP